MNEIQALEWMLDRNATVHVDAADLAGVALDDGRFVDYRELVGVGRHTQVVDWDDGDDGEDGAGGFPALGAAAGMVVGDVGGKSYLDLIVLAVAA